jgi:hypothetical protein
VIVSDNINTRKGPDAQTRLAAHPRVSYVSTPLHGSSLDQVETWFGILTSKCLRGRALGSVTELAAALHPVPGQGLQRGPVLGRELKAVVGRVVPSIWRSSSPHTPRSPSSGAPMEGMEFAA